MYGGRRMDTTEVVESATDLEIVAGGPSSKKFFNEFFVILGRQQWVLNGELKTPCY